jgi:lysyl-tRNA synthetase class 2
LLDYRPAQRLSYRDWFVDGTGLDPWGDSIEAFADFARDTLASVPDTMPDDELDPWLDLLVTHHLESRLGPGAVFVYDYPPSQASLAHVHRGEVPVAERFELYLNGVELANGFNELTNADEQLQRFENDNHSRQANGQVPMPIDDRLVAAMKHGLPGCSGVAVGFDRLVMIAAGLDDLDAAMPFALQRI